jgi:septal ring factor EnvC (AmiA/AmiB activator)
MLLRLSLVIAILAALAVGVLNFVLVKEKIETVEKHRADEETAKVAAQTELASTKKELDKTSADLKQTKETLATTTEQRDKLQAEVASLTKKAADLAEKLAKSTQERDDARAELAAYKATGQTPEQILGFVDKIKKLQETIEVASMENKLLAQKLRRTEVKLAKIIDPDYLVPLPPELKGKVIATDPKWDFVVLDVGEDQGVLTDGELLVNRNGKFVARVRVRTVEKGRCVANIMAGTKLGEVLEGDQVLPAS